LVRGATRTHLEGSSSKALTGYVPFPASDVHDALLAHLSLQAPKATEVAPRVPPDIDAVIARALVKDPDDSWSSASANAAAPTTPAGRRHQPLPRTGRPRPVRRPPSPRRRGRPRCPGERRALRRLRPSAAGTRPPRAEGPLPPATRRLPTLPAHLRRLRLRPHRAGPAIHHQLSRRDTANARGNRRPLTAGSAGRLRRHDPRAALAAGQAPADEDIPLPDETTATAAAPDAHRDTLPRRVGAMDQAGS
jgi:hypothetical protein